MKSYLNPGCGVRFHPAWTNTDFAPDGPTQSQIPNWTSYNLDTEPDGTIYKPDSLFLEAIK